MTLPADFKVGQSVTVRWPIHQPADDCHPAHTLAKPGEHLIVRAIISLGQWPIRLSYHDVTDGGTFSVSADEITPWEARG